HSQACPQFLLSFYQYTFYPHLFPESRNPSVLTTAHLLYPLRTVPSLSFFCSRPIVYTNIPYPAVLSSWPNLLLMSFFGRFSARCPTSPDGQCRCHLLHKQEKSLVLVPTQTSAIRAA